jgi:hypothetical protein
MNFFFRGDLYRHTSSTALAETGPGAPFAPHIGFKIQSFNPRFRWSPCFAKCIRSGADLTWPNHLYHSDGACGRPPKTENPWSIATDSQSVAVPAFRFDRNSPRIGSFMKHRLGWLAPKGGKPQVSRRRADGPLSGNRCLGLPECNAVERQDETERKKRLSELVPHDS